MNQGSISLARNVVAKEGQGGTYLEEGEKG